MKASNTLPNILNAIYFLIPLCIQLISAYNYLATDQDKQYNPDVATLRRYQVDIQVVPFHVLVFYDSLFCSGSLIASSVVLTVASCFHQYNADALLYVKYASDTIINAGKTVRAKELKLHEFYQRISSVDNDIALVIMETHVDFTTIDNVKKIVLNEPDTPLRIDSWIDVSGWGHSNVPPQLENRLIWAEMQVITDTECEEAYGIYKTPSNYCVKYAVERRLSDNGGPAVLNEVLVGVMSYGANRDHSPFVALVTNVSYFHRWIVKNTQFYLEKYCYEHSEHLDDTDGFH